jgi:3-methyladenine DNA glycosylase AlkD
MNVDSLTAEILTRLRALPNYSLAHIRALRREYSKRLAKELPEDILALALRLIDEPGLEPRNFEPRFIAYELIHHHRAALQSLRAKEVRLLARGLDSWYGVDTFAPLVAGPAWRKGQIPDSLVYRWARSKDLWQRRTALVCTVALNNQARGGRGDAARTLAVCRLLVNDREDMVVKALSWALRELAKRDTRAVRAFVKEYEEQLAPRVKREVGNKLRTGVKNPKNKERGLLG